MDLAGGQLQNVAPTTTTKTMFQIMFLRLLSKLHYTCMDNRKGKCALSCFKLGDSQLRKHMMSNSYVV